MDYIQLREKDLSARDLEVLARDILRGSLSEQRHRKTRLLVNSRADVALAVGADGVHLRSEDISPEHVRTVWGARKPIIGVSCHAVDEVASAAASGADFAVFGPVFGKRDAAPTGLDLLRKACQLKVPVLALGGVTLDNARSCVDAGAAGLAAIRLFQDNDISAVMRQLTQAETRN